MTEQLDIEQLIVEQTEEEILDLGLTVATNIGLPVTSWRAGDPTRAQLRVQAAQLGAKEGNRAGFARSAFLDTATGDWLVWKADQDFDYQVPEATFASTDVVLTNQGGGYYEFAVGALTFKNSTNGATYRNTTGGVLASGIGQTLTVTVVAEVEGSDGSAGATEIDEIVSGATNVTCSNPEAAIGVDEQDEDTTRAQCRRKLSALSPNGPRGIYEFVALSPELTGTSGVTRAREYGESDTGDVTLYVAGPSGGASEPDRVLVEEACAENCTPLTITLTVLSASSVAVNVTYELWVYTDVNKTEEDIEEEIESALEAMFAALSIGGDIIPPATTGSLYQSLIAATILGVYEEGFRANISAPAGDTALTNGQVATLGTVDGTIHLVTR